MLENNTRIAKDAAIVDEAILSRRSVRAFLPDTVDETTIRDILEVAARAPSGTNMQPWRVYVTTGEIKQRITDAILNSGIRAEKAKWDEYNIIPTQFFEPYLTPSARRRLRALRRSRHRQARGRPDARAARPQLRLLRRAGRHDLHHRPPAQPGLMDRLRHVPAEHHDGGAGAGACTPARRRPSRPITGRSGRCSAFPTRRSSSAAWRSAMRTRPSPKTSFAPTARRWKSG